MNLEFKIELGSQATRDLKKLNRSNRKICLSLAQRINSLTKYPFSGNPLKGDKKGCYSLRYGDYRIIYEVHPTQKVVLVIRVGHRKEIYR